MRLAENGVRGWCAILGLLLGVTGLPAQAPPDWPPPLKEAKDGTVLCDPVSRRHHPPHRGRSGSGQLLDRIDATMVNIMTKKPCRRRESAVG